MKGFTGRNGEYWRSQDDWSELNPSERSMLQVMIRQHVDQETQEHEGKQVRVRIIDSDHIRGDWLSS